ncbi:restriction endonuclease subunit S, partial [Thiolapillus sp.]
LQQKIAAILSAYDDLIENNLRRIKILEEMTQNLYREWFVKFRFPGHAKVRMVDSPLGKIPEGWEVVTLGELVNIPKGKNITKKTIVPGDVPVVAGGIAPAYYHNAANTRNPVITISASGANAGFVNLYYHDVWASDCSVIDLSATKYVYYFYLLLKDRQYEVTRLQRGAAQPHVYPKDLMALDALSVPEEILEFFARKIGPIFKMIKNMKEKNKNLHQTRDLLLPKLISGELDISELEIDTGKEAA